MLLINAPSVAKNVMLDSFEIPSVSWVKLFAARNDLSIKTSLAICVDRILGCRRQIIEKFYNDHSELIQNTPDELKLFADETMLNGNKAMKVITPNEVHATYVPDVPFPHITAILTHSAVGKAFKPFVILPGLKTSTPDIDALKTNDSMYICSNAKGWMTSHCFALWSIHLVHELSC